MMLVLISLAAADCTDAGLLFENWTLPSGLRGYANSRGVNLNDFDGDGDIDIYLAVAPARVEEGLVFPGEDRLYLNQGDLQFREVGAEFGLQDMCEDRAPLFGDMDGDRDGDLFVTVNGRSVAYRNQDNAWFEDVTTQSGEVGVPGWGHQGFLFDYDQDTFLDIFFTNGPEDGSTTNRLLWNQGDGTWADRSVEAGVAGDPSGKGTCVLDADIDGWPDIFVATGREFGNHLYMNQGDGTFIDEASARGLSDPFQRFGVGANCGDINNDGYPDIVVVTHDHLWSGNQIFLNDGKLSPGTFTDVAPGTEFATMLDGHGSALVDFDLDGWLDLILSGINTPAWVLRNDQQGGFETLCYGAGIAHRDAITWAVAAGDLNGDAYPEVYISHGLGTRPRDDEFYRNLGGTAHYLTVSVQGAGGNSHALGAKIELTAGGVTRTRWVGAWSSFDSQGPLPVTVGLGEEGWVDHLKVTFPTGTVWEQRDLPADQLLVVEEPDQRPDVDLDGVPDSWDICPSSPLGERRDGQGCTPAQRQGIALLPMSPEEDLVWVEPGTFAWKAEEGADVAVQLSIDGTFGPAGRLDLPAPAGATTLTMSPMDWQWLLDNADPSGPILWRLWAQKGAARSVSELRRLSIAYPSTLVRVPLGVNLFSPAHIVVSVGQAVTWWNDSVAAGNLQNEPHDVGIVDSNGSALPNMTELNGAGYYRHTFEEPGTWSYVCHRHSGAATYTDLIGDGAYAHRAPGPYRCMSGSVRVR